MATKEEAKTAVDKIARSKGYVEEGNMEQIEKLNAKIASELRESIAGLRRIAAQSVVTLAKHVYGSGARFVFELLQNADDNSFERARKSGAVPHASFHMYQDRIIVECNEDGFTLENLEAICDVGRSTKASKYGYIGAKGIGFKSVFIAASKVSIQSGHYSFYFEHKKGDDGLGMVTPVWQETDKPIDGPLTRMTLEFHRKGDAQELQHLRNVIEKQLNDLQHTCLMFLRNLRRITLKFYDENDQEKSSREFRVAAEPARHCIAIETISSVGDSTSVTDTNHYHITKHEATNLTASSNREVPETQEGRSASAKAEVVLAFPLTLDANPSIDYQYIFAFLPIRKSNFKFIIHTDFDTNASRQDVNTSSRRNEDLRMGIAEAFVKAVLQFCDHTSLCYAWPQFLPSPSKNWDTFWLPLLDNISNLMRKTKVLKSRHHAGFHMIPSMLILPANAADKDGNSLLDDQELDPFLSKKYGKDDLAMLKEYELKTARLDTILNLLEKDLASQTSKMRSKSTPDEWHTAVASLLLSVFTDGDSDLKARLLGTPLLPIRDGRWLASTRQVWFPTTKGVAIPEGLDLPILDPSATAVPARMQLFRKFKVKEPSILLVRQTILHKYSYTDHHIDLAESRAYLTYLYLTHHEDESVEGIYLYSSTETAKDPLQEDFYLLDNQPYGPAALLSRTANAPGFTVTYLHSTYAENTPSQPSTTHPTWKIWLHDVIGVRERLRLATRDGESLAPVVQYVAKHRPEKFLGLLEFLWEIEGKHSSRNLRKAIRNFEAKAFCQGNISREVPFWQTWLPFKALTAQRQRFMEDSEPFPFLQFEEEDATSELLNKKWMFLHTIFGVGIDDDFRFLCHILRWIRFANLTSAPMSRLGKIFDLYVAIDAKYTGSAEKDKNLAMLQRLFVTFNSILFPNLGKAEGMWVSANKCVWDGPPVMLRKHSLRDFYEEKADDDQMKYLEHLFHITLQIPNATWQDVVAELEALIEVLSEVKEIDDFWIDFVTDMYQYLSTMESTAFIDPLRHTFKEKKLILVIKDDKPGWYTASECLWCSTTEIRGKVTLNGLYEELKDFFLDVLGVKTLTIQMVYDELLSIRPDMTTLDELKSTIWSFNALLQSEKHDLRPEPLIEAHIFPVKYPNESVPVLRTKETEFAIVDRESLASHFSGRVKFLDFNLEEVRQLKPFLEWAGLENRYLSTTVEEITSVTSSEDRPLSDPAYNLRYKAYHLLRIAATFDSPRYQLDPTKFYEVLRTAKVFEATSMFSELVLVQDGELVKFEKPMSGLHISKDPSRLAIYVPLDKREQQCCFAVRLPSLFGSWLMQSSKVDPQLISVLAVVFSSDVAIIDHVLDFYGIININIANQDSPQSNSGGSTQVTEEEGRDETLAATTSSHDRQSPHRPLTPSSARSEEETTQTTDNPQTLSDEIDYDTSDAEIIVRRTQFTSGRSSNVVPQNPALRLNDRPSAPLHTRSNPCPSTLSSAEGTQYLELLGKVIAAAQTTAFPSRGAFNVGPLRDALPSINESTSFESYDGYERMSRLHLSSQFERDKRVGAAGELYVFELLSRLSLRGFGIDNWQSKIRSYVIIHPKYRDMEPWDGARETSDFVYDDTEGDLTSLLVDCGYPNEGHGSDARPRYLIEVKTTTGPCETPFYVSKNQFKIMDDNRASASCRYMIMRVFNVNSDNIGMVVYLNPRKLRYDGKLVFTEQSWSVIPKNSDD